jgi:hypothetical protein
MCFLASRGRFARRHAQKQFLAVDRGTPFVHEGCNQPRNARWPRIRAWPATSATARHHYGRGHDMIDVPTISASSRSRPVPVPLPPVAWLTAAGRALTRARLPAGPVWFSPIHSPSLRQATRRWHSCTTSVHTCLCSFTGGSGYRGQVNSEPELTTMISICTSVTASIICEVGQLYRGPWSRLPGLLQPRKRKRGSRPYPPRLQQSN